MLARLLADLVVLVHFGFIVFAAAGGLLVLRYPRAALFHLPAVLWGAGIEISGAICPLTPLENWLREAGGGAAYDSAFIEHYIMPLVYPPGLTEGIRLILAGLLILGNGIVYGLTLRKRRRAQG